MKQGEIYACQNDVNMIFATVLQDLTKDKFMNVVIRKAKSTKCGAKNCKKAGNYKILIQFFPQIPNKALQ